MVFIGLSKLYLAFNIETPFLNGRGYVCFFVGVILAAVLDKYKIGKEFYIICTLIAVIIPYLVYKQNWLVQNDIRYIMIFIYYPSLVIVFTSKAFSKLLNWTLICELGKISFNVYVWHAPLFLIMFVVLKLTNININLCSVKAMIIFTVICYMAGAVSHYLIERPINKIIDNKLNSIISSSPF